jgi:hypothetical protein
VSTFRPRGGESQEQQTLHLLEFLLDAQLVAVAAFFLAAVGGTGRETRVADTADLLLAVRLLGQGSERGLDGTTTQTQHQVERGLWRRLTTVSHFSHFKHSQNIVTWRRTLLDVVVRQRAAVLELLAGENQALLVRRDALLVLDFLLDIVNAVRRLHVERDGLARQGLHKDLHDSLQEPK